MANESVQALVCDCDGVIVDSEVVAERALVSALSEFAPPGQVAGVIRELFGRSTDEVLALIEQRFGIVLPEQFEETLYVEIEELIATTAEPIAGVRSALESIDLPLAVVSNSTHASVSNSVRRAGLERRIAGRIFTAEMVGVPKPAPEVYLRAVSELQTPAARCLAIEDSAAGVQSAVAAGVPVVGFVGASHIPAGHADRLLSLGAIGVLERMSELPPLVRGLMQ
ncbi:MAG TPA: HAD family phosphatase [Steroidobacteraceae bacterium]|nr:HAD family phosphatase [Steroidobacteraceae bacterium]